MDQIYFHDIDEFRARLFSFVECGAEEEDLPTFAAALNEYVDAVIEVEGTRAYKQGWDDGRNS